MTRWTPEQAEALSPDASSLAAARKLARPGPWSETGSTETLVWGKCQGSGAGQYQVSIDLTGPAFRCTCPSRKLPCKHGLALLLMWVANEGVIDGGAAPASFAAEWQADREVRSAKRAERATDAPIADPEARARRVERRIETMSAGLEQFEAWLRDLVGQGLASCRQRPYRFWDDAAARLVDAQVPGIAERVREMGSEVHRRDDWADHLLAEAGRWFLAVRAWARRDELAPDDLGDLRAYLGWAVSADDIRAGEPLVDQWKVIGVHRTDDGRLQAQRTWLYGRTSGATVLALDFAAVGGVLRVAQVGGSVIDAPVARYAGHAPHRVLLPDEPIVVANEPTLPAGSSIDGAVERMAAALADNPWLRRVPCTLGAVRFATADDDASGWVVDEAGDALALTAEVDIWRVLARTGGHAVDAFGEVEDGMFRPLTLSLPGELVPL